MTVARVRCEVEIEIAEISDARKCNRDNEDKANIKIELHSASMPARIDTGLLVCLAAFFWLSI